MVCVPSCSVRARPQPALGTAGSGPGAGLSAPGSSSPPLISGAGGVGPDAPDPDAAGIARPMTCWPSDGEGAAGALSAGAGFGVGVFAISGGRFPTLGSGAGDSDAGGSAVAESLPLEQAAAP